jgi:hypothetical protein
MTRKSESFEGFVHWLGEARKTPQGSSEPTAEVQGAAHAAWAEVHSVRRAHREALAIRAGEGVYFEHLELLAAADSGVDRWFPRLRTPNGFAISALYVGEDTTEARPVGLLVECPTDLVEGFRGKTAHVLVGGQWIEIGELDVDGKATGDLPSSFEFKPPFAFRVGKLEEFPAELSDVDDPT